MKIKEDRIIKNYVTHRVKDKNNQTVGFIVNKTEFYNLYKIQELLPMIANLKLLANGVFRADSELPTLYWTSIMQKMYKDLFKSCPFVRDIQSDLLRWKKTNRHRILQLEGARQIGKTTELKKFGYKNYEYVIYINIAIDENEKDLLSVLKMGINPISMNIYCDKNNLPPYVDTNKTLLIIDEIQKSHIIYNYIREMENLKCDIIVTGSYLGQTLNKEYFQPAGTVRPLTMFPLSFQEFLRVFKKEKLLKDINLYGKSSPENYDVLLNYYNVYRKIGGYPEVVFTYKNTKNIEDCKDILAGILNIFEKESRNYFSNTKETLIFKSVYYAIITMMVKREQGFGNKFVDIVTKIVKDSQKMLVSRDEVSNAIQWLIYSGIIGTCSFCNEGDILDILPKRRIYFNDVGLFYYLGTQLPFNDKDIDGLTTENFAFAELNRLHYKRSSEIRVKGDSVYFSKAGPYELDFIVFSKEGDTYGIEVKTDTGTYKSLNYYKTKGLIDKAIVAKKTKGGKSDFYNTIPIYTIANRFPYDEK